MGCVPLGARDTRCDLNDSSTLGPAVETGFGASSARTRVVRNAFGLFRRRSAHSCRSAAVSDARLVGSGGVEPLL
jgi:hypothetical protein